MGAGRDKKGKENEPGLVKKADQMAENAAK